MNIDARRSSRTALRGVYASAVVAVRQHAGFVSKNNLRTTRGRTRASRRWSNKNNRPRHRSMAPDSTNSNNDVSTCFS